MLCFTEVGTRDTCHLRRNIVRTKLYPDIWRANSEKHSASGVPLKPKFLYLPPDIWYNFCSDNVRPINLIRRCKTTDRPRDYATKSRMAGGLVPTCYVSQCTDNPPAILTKHCQNKVIPQISGGQTQRNIRLQVFR